MISQVRTRHKVTKNNPYKLGYFSHAPRVTFLLNFWGWGVYLRKTMTK